VGKREKGGILNVDCQGSLTGGCPVTKTFAQVIEATRRPNNGGPVEHLGSGPRQGKENEFGLDKKKCLVGNESRPGQGGGENGGGKTSGYRQNGKDANATRSR